MKARVVTHPSNIAGPLVAVLLAGSAIVFASVVAAPAQTVSSPQVGVSVPNTAEGRSPQPDIAIQQGQRMLQQRQIQQERVSNAARRSIDNANRIRVPTVD